MAVGSRDEGREYGEKDLVGCRGWEGNGRMMGATSGNEAISP